MSGTFFGGRSSLQAGAGPNVSFTLTSDSPFLQYEPSRDASASAGWADSYTLGIGAKGNMTNSSMPSKGESMYRETTMPGASVSVSFTGHGLYVCGWIQNMARYTIQVDEEATIPGAAVLSSNCPGSSLLYANLSMSADLHTVTLMSDTIPTGSALQFWQTQVFSTVPTSSPDHHLLNPSDGLFDFTPDTPETATSDWFFNTASFDDNTLSTWTCTANNEFIAHISGKNHSAFQLLGTLTPNTTTYTVWFNESSTEYSATNDRVSHNQTLFFANNLDVNTDYQMRLVNFSQCLYLDEFLTWTRASPTPTPQLTMGTIAGIVIGSIVGLCVLILLALGFWWCRVHREQTRQQRSVESWAERGFPAWNATPTPVKAPEGTVGRLVVNTLPSTLNSTTVLCSPAVEKLPTPSNGVTHLLQRNGSGTGQIASPADSLASHNSILAHAKSGRLAAMGFTSGLPAGPRPVRRAATERRASQYVELRESEEAELQRVPLDRLASMIARRIGGPRSPRPPVPDLPDNQDAGTWNPPAYTPQTPRTRRARAALSQTRLIKRGRTISS